MKLKCTYCHENAERAERAGLPAAERCMTCHSEVLKESEPIRVLASQAKDSKPYSPQRVNRIPDFVFFSHARHKKAAVDCAECHGPVYVEDARQAFLPATMKTCVDCHKTRKASVSCTICHELNQ